MYTRILLVLLAALFTMGCAGNSLIRGGDVVEIKDFVEVDKKFVKAPETTDAPSMKTPGSVNQGLLLGTNLGYWGLRASGLPGTVPTMPLSDPIMGFFLVHDLLNIAAPKGSFTATVTAHQDVELIRVVDGKLSRLVSYYGINKEDEETLRECEWRFSPCKISTPFTVYKIDDRNFSCVGKKLTICLVNPKGQDPFLKTKNGRCSLNTAMGIAMRLMGQEKLPQK